MPHRVVSLIASATEIVCALGEEESLVGRSHECDFPPSVLALPACSSSRVDPSAASGEIDRQVKAVLNQALSVYRVETEWLDRLEPTLILTQSQCEVCAVSLKDVEAALTELVRSKPAVLSLEPMALPDVWRDIRRVGAALGVPRQADELVASLHGRLDAVRQRRRGSQRVRVACLEWLDPLMAAGNWVPELVEIAGAIDVLGRPGEHSGYLTWEQLAAADPDVIAVMPCGFDIARTRVEMPAVTNDVRWHELRAVRESRVYLTDGNQYFNRPGPRLAESAEILAELCGPSGGSRHHGTGWVRFGDE
jgi:iron complex transport system substrate-binding protein